MTSKTGLLCQLFGHKDPAGGRWNGSYCFGACPRCGSDLVRTAKSGWSAPRGYKVVWKPTAEEHLKIDAREPAEAPQRETPLFDWPQPKPDLAAIEAETAPAEEQPDEQVIETETEIAVDFAAVPEWPLVSPTPAPQAAELPEEEPIAVAWVAQEEPVTAAAAVVEEPSEPVLEAPAVPDFMDDGTEDVDWDDLAPAPQSVAPR